MNKRSIPWVLVGCLALAAGVAAVFVLGIPTNTVLLVALVLACPLAHLWMMRTGMHNHGPQPSHPHVHAPDSRSTAADPRR